MRNAVLSRMSFARIAKLGSYYALGLVSARAKAIAHGEVFDVLADMGLGGLYTTILEQSGAEICKALRICADRRNHPVLFHCSHGKDRTGLTAAIILSLVGAARANVIADYHLSEQHGLSEKGRYFFRKHPEMDPDYWGSAPPEIMEATLNYIDEHYGSIVRYLSHIGFDQTWQRRLISALGDE